MGGWSVTCYFYRYYLQRQGVLVSPWLENIAFHLRSIWLQTLVMIESESCQTSFPSFFSPPSEVAVLLNWNLSRRPFLGHRRASGRVRSAPLHRIRFGTCFFCLPQTIFYLGKPIENSFQLFLANSFKLFSANRFNLFSAVPYFYSEINGWSKDWVKRWARLWTSQPLVGNNFSPIPLKILFQIKKESDSLLPEINRAFKPFWLSTESVLQELQHVFLRSEQVAALSDCHHLWNALSLYSARAVPERGPKR